MHHSAPHSARIIRTTASISSRTRLAGMRRVRTPCSAIQASRAMSPRRIVAHVVRDAVDLDRQLCRRAIEIEAEDADRMLSAEFQIQRPRAEKSPETCFWWGQRAPQPACAFHSPARCWHRISPPPPRLRRGGPPPRLTTGRRKPYTPSSSFSLRIFSCQTSGARWWTLWPSASTATVTGMSCTSNS
jgi:hypothetical protein